MLSSLATLKKFLEQEEARNFDNRAVIGGLESVAAHLRQNQPRHEGALTETESLERLIRLLEQYGLTASQAKRRALAAKIRARLEALLAPSTDKTPSQPAPQADPMGNAAKSDAGEQPPPRTATVQSQPAGPVPTGIAAPVTRLPGIKQGYARRLQRLGVRTISDLLTLYPRRYEDYRTLKTISQLKLGEVVTVVGQVWETRTREAQNRRLKITTSTISDGTATLEVTWFNQPWLENKLKPGTLVSLSGKVDEYMGRLTISSPEYELIEGSLPDMARIQPAYPLTEGITPKWLRERIREVVEYWHTKLPDHLPQELRTRLQLMSFGEALRQIHLPDSFETLEIARRRLAFDELLQLQLGLLRQRVLWQRQQGRPVNADHSVLEAFIREIPFELTAAQHRCIEQIIADLRQPVPMSRLLQGDVGSGKTVVALAAMIATAADSGQAAMMAPTEILAEQHYRNISHIIQHARHALPPVKVCLLTGSTTKRERMRIYSDLAEGACHIAVGTHALIQEAVNFHDLRMVVIDEQHRFGVAQRAALREKGLCPHVLVMSATPIPRSLALTIYGDLDLSIIDVMPPGRQEIKTRVLSPRQRERGYEFIRRQVQQGRQAFIICPLIEESDRIEAKAATEEYERLKRDVFPDLALGLLHGRMSNAEKDAVMTAFRAGDLDVLVSTSVVEVGIDIPNASVMLVEGANRFGLAQLHQFRGRVGRGEYQSYCLLASDSSELEATERLKIIETTQDGFRLAEEDLRLRGPGEFFGVRQSGAPEMKLVRLSDVRLLELARSEASRILAHDPDLTHPQHSLLAERVANFWQADTDLS